MIVVRFENGNVWQHEAEAVSPPGTASVVEWHPPKGRFTHYGNRDEQQKEAGAQGANQTPNSRHR